MVAKKRKSLRNKAAVAASITTSSIVDDHDAMEKVEFEDSSVGALRESADAKAFLHQARETKKTKQLNKQQSFLSKVKERASNADPLFAGISKSAVRRRKRNMREDLKPKMADLLTSLGQEEDLKQHIDNESANNTNEPQRQVTKIIQREELSIEGPGFVRIKRNEPNIRNQKGAKALTISETTRMTEVLSNKSFQQNTFSALRDVIKMQNR